MEDPAITARRMWTLYEPVHVVTYFAPEARQAFERAGLRGFWRGYFAGRSAPLGAADAPRVRQAGAVTAIRRLTGIPDAGGPGAQRLRTAADLLLAATENLHTAGRPLGGPNAALPVPADAAARLWHAATVLREHRGDGHIAALVAAGIDGCEALVLRTAVDAAGTPGAGPEVLTQAQRQAVRGWSDEAWDQAAGRLRDRGWLGSEGAATAAGLAAYRSVEEATDRAAARPWARLGPARAAALAEALIPIAVACAKAVPYPNPVGLPSPIRHA